MSVWFWRAFQISVVALFMYGDWETNFSDGRPGMTFIAAVFLAFGLTILLTDGIDAVRSLPRKFRRRRDDSLSKGALVPRSGSRDLSDPR